MSKSVRGFSIASAIALSVMLIGCGGAKVAPVNSTPPTSSTTGTISFVDGGVHDLSGDLYVGLSEDANKLAVALKVKNDPTFYAVYYILYPSRLAEENLEFFARDEAKNIGMVRRKYGDAYRFMGTVGKTVTAVGETSSSPDIGQWNDFFDKTKELMKADALIGDYLRTQKPDGWPSDWPPDSSAASNR